MESVGCIFYNYLRQADPIKVCLVEKSTGKEVTNEEFLRMTVILAQKLDQAGIQRSDVVTIVSQNNIKYLVTVIAAFYVGARVNLLNPDYLEGELKPLLSKTKPKIVFCTNKSSAEVQKLDLEAKIINYDGEIFDGVVGEFVPMNIDLEDVAFIMTSSGTTGLPKCVLLTHSNIASHLFYFYGLSREERTDLALLPFYHIYGMTVVLSRIFNGHRVIILEKFIPEQFLGAIQEYQVADLYVVPSVLNFLHKSSLVEKYDLSSIRQVYCGATTLAEDTEKAILKKLNLTAIRQGYGMTETTGGVVGVPLTEDKLGSIGKVCQGNEIRICGVENGAVLPAHQVGELRIKGNLVMKGYLDDEEATNEAFDEEGFLKTGDLGYVDDEGFYFIVGRIKDLIKYKGFQVPPAEIESILLRHPAVQDCAVVGVPNEESGEVPLAFVVKRTNKDVSEEELVGYVDGRISVQKRLHGGVRFVEEIPKGGSGKVLRNELKKLV